MSMLTDPTAAVAREPIARRSWVDLAVVLALGLLAVAGFAPTFGGASFLLAGVGGLIAGASGAVIGRILRLGPLTSALVGLLVYFLLGSPFAMPQQALFVVVPSLDTLAGLVVGAVYGWADILTLTTPVAAPDYIAVVPYVAAWIASFVSATLALRWLPRTSRSPAARSRVLVPMIVLYITGVLLGTDQPYLAVVRGALLVVISISWMLWRMPANDGLSAATRRAILRRRLTGFGVVLGVGALVGSLLGTAVAPTAEQRFVLRDQIEPPLERFLFSSPLAGFRQYHQIGRLVDETIMRVEGLEADQRIRIAAMDYYDGRLWRVTSPTVFEQSAGGFDLVGSSLPEPEFASVSDTATVSIELVEYDDVWLPTVGYPREIRFDAGAPSSTSLRYSPMSGTALITSGVEGEARYTMFVDVQEPIDVSALASYAPASRIPASQVADVADVITRGQELAAGASAPFQKLVAIEQALANAPYSLSHGKGAQGTPTPPGHNLARLNRLMLERIGNDEQYAAAMAVMAHQLGFPVRVVVGFAPERSSVSSPVEVRGSDAIAWVEVAVERQGEVVGWLPLEPTPEQEVPPPPEPQPRPETQALIRQPPPLPNVQDDLVTPTEIVESDADDEELFEIPTWVWTLVGWTVIPLAIIFLPMLVIGALKARRRQQRRSKGSSDRQAAGAWDELVDTYAELGYAASRRSTRVGLALDFERQFRAELDARRRERVESADRDAARAESARLRAESRTAARAARVGTGETVDRSVAADETVVRSAQPVLEWRPGVEQKHAPLPAIPGLREFAVDLDRAVFSGTDVGDAEVDRLWGELEQATTAARASVTPVRRLLSRYRMRPRNDIVADLSDRLTDAAARRRPRGAPAS